jgi:hypothetical protein
MLAFARTLGFRFRAHRVGHPDRKACVAYYTPFVWLTVSGTRCVEPRQPGFPLAIV